MGTSIRTLIRLEARLLWRARTPWLVTTLFFLTSVAAIVNGTVQWRRHHAAASLAVQQQSEQYASLRADVTRVEQQRAASSIPVARLQPGLPSPAAVEARLLNFRAAVPPLPTAILNTGALQAVPQRYELRAGGGARFWPFGRTTGNRILSGFAPEQPLENPSGTVIGAFDLAFVPIYVYPLLILGLAYNIVSADREAGILPLVGAQPLAFRRWLAARTIGRGAVVGLGLLPSLIVTAIAIPEWSSEVVLRLTLWGVAVLLYCLFWLGVAIAVSVRTASASVSAVVATAAWLIVVMVVPGLVSIAGPFLTPPATRIAYANEERAASLDLNPRVDNAIAAINQEMRVRLGNTTLRAHSDHPSFTDPIAVPAAADLIEALEQPPWSTVMPAAHLSRALAIARRTLVEQRLAPVLRVLAQQERREAAFFAIARYASPALLMQSLIDDLAGTGHHRRMRFLGQLDDHVREVDAFFTQRILGNRNITSEDFQTLTPFHYREDAATSLLTRVALPLFALLAMCFCCIWASAGPTKKWKSRRARSGGQSLSASPQ